jgi:hypothetical protein
MKAYPQRTTFTRKFIAGLFLAVKNLTQHLPSKHEALSSNPNTTTTKKKEFETIQMSRN